MRRLYRIRLTLADDIVVVAESRDEARALAMDEADDFIADSTSRPLVGEAVHVMSESQLPVGWSSESRPYSADGGEVTVAEILSSTFVDERQLCLFPDGKENVGESDCEKRNAPGLRPGTGEECGN